MIVVTNVRRPGVIQSLGVFSATFLVRGLQDILDRATSDRPGVQAALLNPDGGIVASTHPGIGDRVPALAAALPAPLAKLPLDVSIPLSFAHAGVAYDGGLHAFRLGHGGHWVLAFFLPETTVYAAAYRGRRLAAVMGLAVLALGVVLGTLVAARIAGPLRTIAADLAQIARFRLSSIPSPQSFVREVAVVADSVDRMKAGLRSFAHYVPTDLVRALLERGAEAELGGETRVLTFHFSDIENFTTLSEHLAPDEVVQTLAEYLECMMDVIRAQGGTVKDFFGDGIMAFWNAPNPVPDHAARACRAALRARADLGALHARWAAAGKPVYRARIGLHTGAALVGNFGTRERFAFAAVGDKVNLASRLEGLNKVYGTYILASESTQAAAGGGLEWRTLDRVAVAGRTGSTLVCELLGEQGQVRADVLEARDRYEEALAAYFARQFPEAAKGFAAVTALRHHDRAAQTMAGRAEMYALSPPPPDWVGVHVQTMK
jgi:adenylate cyclase